VPVQQKAYYRIREAVADLDRIIPMLSYTPPSYDTAKIIVQSVYKSVDEHLPYLEEAVGFTPSEAQAIGEKPHGATGEGKTAPLP
jgi:hypothetical protein